MATYPAYPIPVAWTVDDLIAKTRAAVAEHGGVVWVGRRGRQARQACRLQAAARAEGYPTQYFRDEAGPQILSVFAGGPGPVYSPRVIGWWGAAG
jgi:hypothetical protein